MAQHRALVIAFIALVFLFSLGGFAQQSGLIVGQTGSGFIVSPDGYILTNAHVIRDATKITVYVGGQSYPATVVAISEASDLALLKIPASGLFSVRLGNSLFVEVLDRVVAMGYPKAGYGKDLTASTGEITGIRTNVPGREGKDTLQHNAVITYGSSGGPLFNIYGEVIGVNYAGDPPLNWAIPINEAIPLLRSVPGFDPRAMGSAETILSPSAIVATYRAAVVFIECPIEIALHEFLPRPSLISGITTTYDPWSSGPSSCQPVLLPLLNPLHCHWLAWLRDLGFRVIAAESVEGVVHTPIPSTLGGTGSVRFMVFLFPTRDEADRASQHLLVRASSDPGHQVIGEGSVRASGIPARYRLSAYCWCDKPMCGGVIRGLVVFVLDTLVFVVNAEHTASLFSTRGEHFAYESGYLVYVSAPDLSSFPQIIQTRQRLVSGEYVAAQLQQLADLAATVAVNRFGR